ncbi:FAD-dependent oxidoreductase [Rugamonas rivuli]|uniref:FAD-dependent oxidoreductase n=1 Tax=Rugamonas rivuli TaxID=2743358 RepID=A0A843SNS8_9BURK|nr:FAD-dependent oxidoreductase [Rugamonas rivuli]MQA23833.1 FAD-dependent oxidoreductase [Rugamonas rivuli]
MHPSPTYDVIVVGSGPGGASVARELARRQLRVLVLEQGSAAPLEGTLTQMAGIAAVPGKSAFLHRDASLLVSGIAAGGTSTINFATAAPPPLAMFAAHGIDLGPALESLRAELPMGPLPDTLIGGSVRIGEGVDSTLQTGIANLYVCDASVIPQPWGLPPTLTLLCLGKRLGQFL